MKKRKLQRILFKFQKIRREKIGGRVINSRAFGSSSLCFPVVVAGARLLVSISPRRNTLAFETALLAEEQAWLFISCFGAPILACPWALQKKKKKILKEKHKNVSYSCIDLQIKLYTGVLICCDSLVNIWCRSLDFVSLCFTTIFLVEKQKLCVFIALCIALKVYRKKRN